MKNETSNMVEIDIVIPVYNEEKDLEKSILKLCNWAEEHPKHKWIVTIANNASTDKTLQVANELKIKFPKTVRVIDIPRKGRGIAIGTSWLKSNSQICAFMDVDLSTALTHIPEIIEPIINNEADLCIGSRWLKESEAGRNFFRGILSWSYNQILKTILHLKTSDAQCGFKGIRTDLAKKIIPLIEDKNWFFDTELLVIAQKNNFRIKEIPVKWTENVLTTVIVTETISEFLKGVWRMKKNGVPDIS